MSRGGGGQASDVVERVVATVGRETVHQLLAEFIAAQDSLDPPGDQPDDDFGWMVHLRRGLLHLWRDALSHKEAHQRAADDAGRQAGELWDLLLVISKRIRIMQSLPTRRLRPATTDDAIAPKTS